MIPLGALAAARPAPAGGGVVAFDDFNRANGPLGATPVGGFPWTSPVGGIYTILAGQASFSSAPAGRKIAAINTGTSNGRISTDLTLSNATIAGLCFRYADPNNYWTLQVNNSSDNALHVRKLFQGTFSTVGPDNMAPRPFAGGETYNIAVDMHDSTFTVWLDGEQVGTVNVAGDLSDAIQHGFFAFIGNNQDSLARFDNFEVTT